MTDHLHLMGRLDRLAIDPDLQNLLEDMILMLPDGSASDQEKSVAAAPSEQETRSELLKANLLNSVLVLALEDVCNQAHSIANNVSHIQSIAREALSQAERGRS